MLRSPELCCPRLAAVIKGVRRSKIDLSNHVIAFHESLVKVLIGTNEEAIKVAKEALLTLYASCNSESANLVPVTDYLRKVWNGKEGKISQASTKGLFNSVEINNKLDFSALVVCL